MRKIILIIIIILISTINVDALSKKFYFDTSKLSLSSNSKEKNVISNFDKKYNLTYSITTTDNKLENEISLLTKKTTYLLFGDFNNKNESSQNYYKRKKDWYSLRYNPKIPTNSNNKLDTNSQEYKDDLISGMAIPQIFSQATELGLLYNSYGDINITKNNDTIISTIILPNVKIKEQNKIDPMKYDYVETNYIMHYYYKKLDDEWKLYYLYGEDSKEIDSYINEIENNESTVMAIAPSYQSQLSTIYNLKKLEELKEEQLDSIYNSNINNIVFLNSYYNNMINDSANGFFIQNNIIVTTWNFLEKSLIKSQYITISNSNNTFELEGIITANPETDIAVIKVKNSNNTYIKLGDYKNTKVEDPIITISSKLGVGTIIQKGIITSNNNYIQTSIPLSDTDEGSPLFNINGEVIGLNTSKSTQSSISTAINSDVLKEIQDKINSSSINKIQTISFEELKEKYYYDKNNNENIINSISKNKWKKYSKIGNINENIKLELTKSSYKDGIVSLRYKNNISKYISSIQLATNFETQLIKDGYEKNYDSTNKKIYSNKEYQIIIMEEFDYLIIVMVKL